MLSSGLLISTMSLLAKKAGARGLKVSCTTSESEVLPKDFLNKLSKRESRTKCTLIPGDGVGPELMHSLRAVFNAANCPVDFEIFHFSEIDPTISSTLEDVAASIRKNKICLKGILATPNVSDTGELQTYNMKLRTALDLFANVVHVRSLPGVKTRHADIDCVIIREQTEGEFSALEHESVPGVVECLKITTARKSARIAKFAFDYATKNHRKKVTCVHKANIMKAGDGLFLKCCEDISKLYPRIEFEKMIVDNTAMQLVSNPNQFDVMVAPNLYGNILNNIACGLVGGAGVVAGAGYSDKIGVFEPGARHTFRSSTGTNTANPTATLLSGAKLLRHINLQSYSDKITRAVNEVLKNGNIRTEDLGGHSTTTDFTHAVISSMMSQ